MLLPAYALCYMRDFIGQLKSVIMKELIFVIEVLAGFKNEFTIIP